MYSFILIGIILSNFILLTKSVLTVPVGMMMAAGTALVLSGGDQASYLMKLAFSEFSLVALLFTAVAVPAHILERSETLEFVGMKIGEIIGKISKKRIDLSFLIVTVSLFTTYIMAAIFHNTTSILVMASVIVLLCKSYRIPVIPVLGGALVASNLGGFSTRWGDTPNIIEAHTWNLGYGIFFREIMPINIGLLLFLILFITILVKIQIRKNHTESINGARLSYATIEFRARQRNMSINKRLMTGGLLGLIIAIIAPLLFPAYEVPFSIFAIFVSLLFVAKEDRQHSLFVLGIETYATLLAIFMLAKVIAESTIGFRSQLEFILQQNTNIAVIVVVSYIGTLFTEAASWASAASPIVHGINDTTRAAWAVGAGICAGSSSLITAATAGIILLNETKDNEKDSRITFRNYLPIGFVFSLFMIIYYIIVLPLFI